MSMDQYMKNNGWPKILLLDSMGGGGDLLKRIIVDLYRYWVGCVCE